MSIKNCLIILVISAIITLTNVGICVYKFNTTKENFCLEQEWNGLTIKQCKEETVWK